MSPRVKALYEWGARWAESEGEVSWSRAVAGLTLSGEQTTLSAAGLWGSETRRGIGGSQDSSESIPVGVAEKQFVVHLGTFRQKVSRPAVIAKRGVKRSARRGGLGLLVT